MGSISFELQEESVRTAFETFGPIRSVNMSFDPVLQKHKGFAFVEYDMPEAAQLALEQMGGTILGGRNIKIGRPSNMPMASPFVDEILAECQSSPRIFVASVHAHVNEDDLTSVFGAFGDIVSVELVKLPGATEHRGYGFLEYKTAQSAHDAIASMNLFDLAGQFLRVGRVSDVAVFNVDVGFFDEETNNNRGRSTDS